MPAICHDCRHEVSVYTTKFRAGKILYFCKPCEHPVHSDKTLGHNPFADLTLEHAHDEFGRPVHVSSLRQLHEAEKRYNFRSLIGHTDEAKFNEPPPQRQTPKLTDVMTAQNKWLFPEIAVPMVREMRERGEII